MVKEVMLSFLSKFEIYMNGCLIDSISKEFTFFVPKYNVDYKGWHIEGDFFGWDYKVLDSGGSEIASIYKEIFNPTDTYVIDVNNQSDVIYALMLVLAIDAEKCCDFLDVLCDMTMI